MRPLFDRLAAVLRSGRAGEGFGPRLGLPAEAEPSAMVALALDDEGARGWLQGHQHADGGFGIVSGDVNSDSATGLAAMALPAGGQRERALDHLVAYQAREVAQTSVMPHDPNLRGWGWTPTTFGWVEPTARAVLALRLLRTSATARIHDGVATLADRECHGGGWNYGNPVVLGVPLEPFVQTTAIALVALQGLLPDVVARGTAVLDRRWASEPGGLSLALTLVVHRLSGAAGAAQVEARLDEEFRRTGLLDDTVALAWAAIATGPGLERVRVV